ncbi:hypothetical protein [Falsiroseomonas tokyonensis]|uniref:Uncharacterized protein n=1 Tax=Falsiroseomonas tokyonensis TaxID=430521 RepID=A0ABV7BUD7_9PROT|nr:hypothetical protein [Falsiroseomonas tokyonensis]MBU8539279.1 hypothetical protein [Falsiroseomonas tokyonensis]
MLLCAGLAGPLPAQLECAELPLPPQAVGQVLEAHPELQRLPSLPLAGGLTLHLLVPDGDDCSPQAAWLLCPGLRLAGEGDGAEAPLRAAWLTLMPPAPLPLAPLRAEAIARHGAPEREAAERDMMRGFDMPQHRMLWRLADQAPALRLEAVFVLEDAPDDPAAPRVLRIGWSATPDPSPPEHQPRSE